MPTFSTESSAVVRAASDHFSLCLKSRHRLVVGPPSQDYTIKTRFPEEIDVFLASDLVVTLYGSVDRVKVSNQDVLISAVAGHLVRYLEMVSYLLIYSRTCVGESIRTPLDWDSTLFQTFISTRTMVYQNVRGTSFA